MALPSISDAESEDVLGRLAAQQVEEPAGLDTRFLRTRSSLRMSSVTQHQGTGLQQDHCTSHSR